jgi:hypothetical protein
VNPYAAPEVTPTGRNSLARASFVIAIVLVVVGITETVIGRFIPMIMQSLHLGSVEIGVLFGALSFLDLLLGALALGLGIMGVRQGGDALRAGIGIGVGGLVAILALVSLVTTPLVALLY